jgi:hypothetical protein
MKLSIAFTLPVLALTLFAVQPVQCFPQYQAFVEKNSGRSVNCAMCHRNDDGPIGTGLGQIGSLSKDDLIQINKARISFEPGSTVNNPILNKFGNEIIHKIGMKKFLELLPDPGKLPQALGNKSDLDDDGIADAQEYLDGTDPLNKYHGDPLKLFFINLNRSKFQILLTTVAVLLLGYGLTHLLMGFSQLTKNDESK